MSEAGRRWINLFEKEGWFRFGALDPAADLADIAVFHGGGEKNILGFKNIVDVMDEFLVFEYPFDSSSTDVSGNSPSGSGTVKVWVPWEKIEFVFQTLPKSEE